MEKSHRIYLDSTKPLVIRLDGKNVTKDKEHYNLTEKAGYVTAVRSSVIDALKGFRCEACLYSIMDEISVIISDSRDFFRNFEDTNQLYCAGIFLQRFLSSFRISFSTEFGISMFNLSEDDIPDYIKWRKEFGKMASAVYAAKKFEIEYREKETEEILKELKNTVPEWQQSHTWFFDGILDMSVTEIPEEVMIEF